MNKYLHRLMPATHAAALVASIAHVVSLAFMSGSFSLGYVVIAFMTYIATFLLGLPGGALLLTSTGFLRLGVITSFFLFFIVIQGVAVALIMFFFEMELSEIPLQYAFISIPTTLTAWYFSVYYIWKERLENEKLS